MKEIFNHNKRTNIKRNLTFIDKKPLIKSFPKNLVLNNQEKLKTKIIHNPKMFSGLENIIDNENEDDDISELSKDTIYNESREIQLKILNEKYTKLYHSKEKAYLNIVNEIDVEKQLFYKGSIMSFNLLVLKIKCLMKLLKEKFEINLKSKDDTNYSEVDIYIQKIKYEFKKIFSMLNEDSKYEYELFTQVYCKFLYIIAIISNHKEEYTKSLSYITLGVNMLKVFFVRQKIATDINTYKIYAKLIILLINKLLTDDNISQTLIYINLLSKIIEIGLNIVYKNKLNKKYEYRFNKFNGYNFLFLGYCYELKNNITNNSKITFKVYKEAFYFMNKSIRRSIFSDGKNEITIEKKALILSQLLYEKLKDILNYEALKKQKELEQKEKIKKQLIKEAKSKEKKHKLELIANGFTPDSDNLKEIEYRIYNKILTTKNQNLMDKLDDELISFVYKDKQNQNVDDVNKNINNNKLNTNKKGGKLEKKLPSNDIMKNLCHYKIYNSLMSNDFKEFLLKNKKLEFNNPYKQKISLDKIQKFLNAKIKIKPNSESINKGKDNHIIIKENSNISSENNITTELLNTKNMSQNKKYKLIKITKNNVIDQNSSNYSKYIKNKPSKSSSRRHLTTNDKHSFIISKDKDKDNTNRLNKRHINYSKYTASVSSIKSNSNKNNEKKLNSKSMITNGSYIFENRKIDKYIFNNKYFKEYIYFEKLTDKELDFQKKFLESKNNNSKMYFKGFNNELQNNGKISRDEIYNSFLILNNAVNTNRNYEKEMKSEIEIKNKPKLIGNVFKSVTNKMKEGKEIKNAMMKVLDRYKKEQKKNNEKKNINRINIEEINKKNEYSIMKLNDNIKEINNLLISKNNGIKKDNTFINYNDT